MKDRMQGLDVTLVYNVYVIDFNVNKQQQLDLIRRFYDEKRKTDERRFARLPIRRTYDENDMMSFDTLDEFYKKNRWDFITKNVLENPEFVTAINSLNRQSFSIR